MDIRLILSKIFSIIIFKRLGISLDISSKIIGKQYIQFGKGVSAGKYLWIEAISGYQNKKFIPQIVIKDNVSISDFCHIGAVNYIEIGNNVLFGSKVYVTDHNHGIYSEHNFGQSDPEEIPICRALTGHKVIIEDNVWLGDNVVVLPGVTIGRGCIIGAGAVVTKSVPAYSIAVGVPARVVKMWNVMHGRWEASIY